MSSSLRMVFAALALLALAACSTVESRVAAHRAAYDSWPPDVQQKVNAGRIAVGFTKEQVEVALGRPDSAFSRTMVTGSYEVWSYGGHRGRWRVGVGMGSFHGGSAFGSGVSVAGGGRGQRLSVVFDANGRVSQIEQLRG